MGSGWRGERQRWRRQRVGTRSKCKDSHYLGVGAVGSSSDHLQAVDVLGMDSGGGGHTHALQTPLSFFRFCWERGQRERGAVRVRRGVVTPRRAP